MMLADVIAPVIQIDSNVLMWMLGGTIAVLITLVGTVWLLFNRSVDSRIEHLVDSVNDNTEKISNETTNRLNDYRSLEAKIDAEKDTRTEKYDNLKDKISDIDTTVAGFGGIYLTRHEFQKEKDSFITRHEYNNKDKKDKD